ncbi:glycine zipper family protein [Pelovirga terrestris]|uniref:Glycine zipper 2TM domain-containing protein n=1 Tax=Pelovirga terrestris TaxID=2771352 RepID=A0A8J6QX82_9BACT|nr:glycine zipper domain-containing protein [Pelovirga terrestris]MBD1400002.1 glycine zipper 2TM domain-containing protein [Pelovirga terrestris]
MRHTFILLFTGVLLTGCAGHGHLPTTQQQAIFGAATGALIGNAVQNTTRGTLLGAGIGTMIGIASGYAEDQQKERNLVAYQTKRNGYTNCRKVTRTTVTNGVESQVVEEVCEGTQYRPFY